MSLAGWPDAACGNEPPESKCPPSYVIGSMSSTPCGQRHISQWPSTLTGKPEKSDLSRKANAFSEMINHMTPLREFYVPSEHASPRTTGFDGCGSASAHLRKKQPAAGDHAAHHFLVIQQVLGNTKLDNVHWPPGAENSAGGLAKVTRDMAPLLHMVQSGPFCPGALRPLRNVSFRKNESGRNIFYLLLQITRWLPRLGRAALRPNSS